MKEALFLNTKRNGYSPDQCGKAITVQELIDYLQEQVKYEGLDGDSLVFFRNDDGYTYGNVTSDLFVSGRFDEDLGEVKLDSYW